MTGIVNYECFNGAVSAIAGNGMGLYARSRCAVAQALAGYGVKPLL